MYQNKSFHLSSIALVTSRNHQLTLITVKAGFKTIVYENTNLHRMYWENVIFMQFYFILPDILSFIQQTLDVIRNNW